MKTKILILCLLLCLTAGLANRRFQQAAGIDFYHYWAVQKLQSWDDPPPGNLYLSQPQHAETLNAYADRSSDRRLKSANRYRKEIDLTGTPLFYAAFWFLPGEYSSAFGLFQFLQNLSFIGAIVLLGWLYRADWFEYLAVALMLVLVFAPFESDLRVGNSNSFQLVLFVFLTVFVTRILPGASETDRVIRLAVFLSMLGAAVLFKPNLILVSLLLIVHTVVKYGIHVTTRAGIIAGMVCLGFIVLPCLYYDSWTLWNDWYRFVYGEDPAKLGGGGGGAIDIGNFPIVHLVARQLGIGVFPSIALMGMLIAVSGGGVMVWSASKDRRTTTGIYRKAIQILEDPDLVISIGIILMFALSPLIWMHYYMLLLLPGLWMLWERRHKRYIGWAGALSIFITSGVYLDLSQSFRRPDIMFPVYALSWIPLWIGILAIIATQEREKGKR